MHSSGHTLHSKNNCDAFIEILKSNFQIIAK